MNKAFLIVGAALLLSGGSFALGRYVAPERVVVTEKLKIETVIKEVVVEKVVTEVKVVKATDTINNVITQRVIETKPDGSVVVHETTTDKTEAKTKTEAGVNQTKDTTSSKDTKSLLDKEKTKIVERNRPNWSLALMPGFDIAGVAGHGTPYSLLPSQFPIKHMVVGASIEHRLIGPVSTGVWANTSGAAGLVFRLEF